VSGVVAGLNDVSMEEVRLNAYEAKLRGDLTSYVSTLCCLYRSLAVLVMSVFCHVSSVMNM